MTTNDRLLADLTAAREQLAEAVSRDAFSATLVEDLQDRAEAAEQEAGRLREALEYTAEALFLEHGKQTPHGIIHGASDYCILCAVQDKIAAALMPAAAKLLTDGQE